MSKTNPAIGPQEPWRITLGEMDERMGLEILEQGVEKVVARIPVEGNRQSFGLLHGGALLALGEACGSWAAVIHASTHGMVCVGVDVSASHLRSTKGGWVTATATPVKLGRTLDVHQVDITDDDGKLLSTFRITNLLREKDH
ncbi:PaaI family thioesterase [Luteococcus sp. H138]|uniref:PaaI family thioesterase n=1 Tax=unclassified Luteococcus TaxID=2639923 RepID=UPI00313C70BC